MCCIHSIYVFQCSQFLLWGKILIKIDQVVDNAAFYIMLSYTCISLAQKVLLDSVAFSVFTVVDHKLVHEDTQLGVYPTSFKILSPFHSYWLHFKKQLFFKHKQTYQTLTNKGQMFSHLSLRAESIEVCELLGFSGHTSLGGDLVHDTGVISLQCQDSKRKGIYPAWSSQGNSKE